MQQEQFTLRTKDKRKKGGNMPTLGYTGDNISIPSAFSRAEYRQPPSDNYLLNTSFKFSLKRTPNLTWFCQRVSVPSLSFGHIDQPTRFGARLPIAGTGYEFEDLTVDFVVDEDVNAWMEIYNWMTGIGNPIKDDKKEYIPKEEQTSDAQLLILSSSYNAKYKVTFYDIFPTSLGALNFDSTVSETEPVVSSATFKYRYYEIEEL